MTNRYRVPRVALADFITTSKERAEERAESNDSEVKVTENVRPLDGKKGTYSGWTYWSDGVITPGLEEEELEELTLDPFSDDARTLIAQARRSQSDPFERLEDEADRLKTVEEILFNDILETLDESYGVMRSMSHSLVLRRLVTRPSDVFYLVEEIYVTRNPDGQVDRYHRFFDDLEDAQLHYHSTYAARFARRAQYEEARLRFAERHQKRYVYVDEDGTVNLERMRLFHDYDSTRVDWQPIQVGASREEQLCYAISHYVPTGQDFGHGITYRAQDSIYVTLGHGVDGGEEFEKLTARLEEIEGLDAEIITDSESRGTAWYRIRVHLSDAYDLADALRETPGPNGWGWPKTEFIDHYAR